MSNLLDDTQKSLAAALARIEIQRLRIEKLKFENVHLRNVLRAHEINPGEASEAAGDADAPASEGQAGQPGTDDPIEMPTDNAEEKNAINSDSHDVLLHTGSENTSPKIAGRVTFKEDRIEFVAVAGDIQPNTFVGVRYLGDKLATEASRPNSLARRSAQPARTTAGASGTWWDSLFGSQDNLPSAGGMSGSMPPRFQTTPTGITTPRGHMSESPALSPRAHPAGFPPIPVPNAARTRQTVPIPSGTEASQISMSQASLTAPGDSSDLVSRMSAYLRRRSLPEAPVASDRAGTDDEHEGETGTWQMLWRPDKQGAIQTLTFDASSATRARIQSQVEEFQAISRTEEGTSSKAPERTVTPVGSSRVRDPEPLIPGDFMPQGAKESRILSEEEVQCIAGAIPGRRKLCNWKRLYCSEEHGFSLQTLYRAGTTAHYSLLVVEDFNGYVFGSYCTEALKVNPRYQGNGECFVFQVQPTRSKYDWHQGGPGSARNDFFMMMSNDSLGIGGAPHFAIWLDSDLLYGNSGLCNTFSSPCLAGEEDFKIKAVELWGLKT